MRRGDRLWSADDAERLRALVAAGERIEAIAEALNRTVNAVRIRTLRDCRDLRPTVDYEAVIDPMERWGHGKAYPGLFWTRERCTKALQQYARRTTGRLPISTPYEVVKKGDASLPPSARLYEHFGSLTRAWLACLPSSSHHRVPLLGCEWSAEEDDFLLSNAGTLTLKQCGERLHRSWAACKRRLYDLGTTSRNNQGFMSAQQVADEYGCSPQRVTRFIRMGVLPSTLMHGNRHAIDPMDAKAIADLLSAPPSRGKGWKVDENGRPIPPKAKRKPEPVVFTRYQQHEAARREAIAHRVAVAS